jgi:hypothetical protein
MIELGDAVEVAPVQPELVVRASTAAAVDTGRV